MILTIRGQAICLRPLRTSDSTAIDAVIRDRRTTRFLPRRVQLESGAQFVARSLKDQREKHSVFFAILSNADQRAVGEVSLLGLPNAHAHAELGVMLSRRFWGRGYGSESVRLCCRYGFQRLRLHRITARVVSGNCASDRMLRKVGFVREGVLRGEVRSGSRWLDVWIYGLLRRELSDSFDLRGHGKGLDRTPLALQFRR